MTIEEQDAYYGGQEDGEVGFKSPQQPGESDLVYKAYLNGFRDGQMRSHDDLSNDGASAEFWR